MKILRVCVLAFSVALLAATAGFAQQPQAMPATLKALFGLAPGCSVMESMQMADVEMCHLNCGAQKTVAVAKYYNDRMVAQGFEIQAFVEHADGTTVVGGKGESTAGADVSVSNGKTMATLTLDRVQTLGGTDIGQQIVQNGAQPGATAPTTTTPQAAVESGGTGYAQEIFKLVPLQSGDKLVEEIQVNGNPVAMAVSPGSIKQILTYYESAVAAQGWTKVSRMEDTDGGIVILMKDNLTFQVICDDEPETPGVDYALMLNK